MQSSTYKITEFFIIFFVIPICFVLAFPLWIKMGIAVLGFAYIVYVLLKIERKAFKMADHLNWSLFIRNTLLKTLGIAVITIVFVYYTKASDLFIVFKENPTLWIKILFIYSLFSVYPQELIFRTFYFQRYESFFKTKTSLLLVNALVFSLAHLFFRNTLVLILTFLGGVLFAYTYYKTNSTLLVSIEHAIYGSWLFTVGMGDMLGFPSSDFHF